MSPLLFNIVLEVLATAIREEKEVKGIQIRKEKVKLPLFPNDMILYIEDPKDATRKILNLINEFGKVAGYRINTQKNLLHIYTLKKKKGKKNPRKNSIIIASKRIKYQGINILMNMKDLYSKNYKIPKNYIKEHIN